MYVDNVRQQYIIESRRNTSKRSSTKLGKQGLSHAAAELWLSQRQPGLTGSELGPARSPRLGCSSAEPGAADGSSRLQLRRGNTSCA
jgi:hypothetical protein